jgi:hypothetical protein
MKSLAFTLTRDQLEQKRAEAKQQGFDIEGDKGDGDSKGVKFSYGYDGSTLRVVIKRVSFADKLLGWDENHIAEALTKILTV